VKAKKSAAATASAVNDEMTEVAGESALNGFNHYVSNFQELADLGRDNFAAVVQCNAVLTQGFEAISKEVLGYARTSFESAAATTAALLAAKTFEDVVQVNSEFAKASFERLVERTAKLSEMGVKVANEAFAPLGTSVETAVQKLTKSAA
jgi:phasin family protein